MHQFIKHLENLIIMRRRKSEREVLKKLSNKSFAQKNQKQISEDHSDHSTIFLSPGTNIKRKSVAFSTSCNNLESAYNQTKKKSKRKMKKQKTKYNSILSPKDLQDNLRRRLWTEKEDEAIITLVKRYGICKWTLIARKLQEKYKITGRSGKQCRER